MASRSRLRRSFTVESSRVTRHSVDSVLDLLLSPATWPRWQPEIVSVSGPEKLAVGDVVEGRARMLGFDVDGRSTTVGIDAHDFEEDVIVGVRMRVSYRVEPSDQGSIVTRKLVAELPGGFAGRVLSLLLRPRLRAMQKEVLDALARAS
ncbi:MAG TPA: SRPBCC family protein [Actinomycetota bacterium]|nr:SRPBCC family protein [Actinomycetota bacterium]